MRLAEEQKARNTVAALRAFVRRADLTGWVKDRNASGQYERAYAALVELEDAAAATMGRPRQFGERTARRLGATLRELAAEARDRGLLTAGEQLEAERLAVEAADRRRELRERRWAELRETGGS